MWATKYRPKTFDEVVGQSAAIDVLKNSVGKSTTFILYGESGVGKTTLARIFADYVNGEALEINGADNNGVDDVRGIVSAASYIPAFNDYRVFIIDECHMLTTQAWNALLKILEESPKTTLWMLCTTEYAKIPDTIKSRSTSIRLNKITVADTVSTLERITAQEGLSASATDLDSIARWAGGHLRDAISKLETYLLTGSLDLPFGPADCIKLLNYAFTGDTPKTVDMLNRMSNQDIKAVINFVADYIRLLLLRRDLGRTVSTEDILDQYTNIGSANIEGLRVLQDTIWQRADGHGEQWALSLEFIYTFYDRLVAHYNDFRDARASFEIAVLYTVGQVKR